jgi:hypothetical protein
LAGPVRVLRLGPPGSDHGMLRADGPRRRGRSLAFGWPGRIIRPGYSGARTCRIEGGQLNNTLFPSVPIGAVIAFLAAAAWFATGKPLLPAATCRPFSCPLFMAARLPRPSYQRVSHAWSICPSVLCDHRGQPLLGCGRQAVYKSYPFWAGMM